MFAQFLKKLQTFQFTSKQQQAFLEDLAALVKDGVPVNRAVETIGQISKGIGRDVATEIAAAISRGQLLAEGMQGWFSPSIVEIVRAGENSGNLAETIERASLSLGQQTNAVGTIIAALVC